MTTGSDGSVHLVFGPIEHGVTRHALELAEAAGEHVLHLGTPSPPEPAAVFRALAGGVEGQAVHLHVTDRLCGRTPEDAAALIERIARDHRLTVTLHDLPQPSDGELGFPRRAAAYRRMAAAARGVQVCSRHEQLLLQAIAPGAASSVVPLPVPDRTSGRVPAADVASGTQGPPTVGVLGYLYPGKGHAEVLAALDRLDRPDVSVVALGRASDGHDWLVDDLQAQAGSRNLEITGYLDDDALDHRIRTVTVPVVAHTHLSASGSLHRWIGCGRRPVTTASRYTIELASRMPGTLTLTDDLPRAIEFALTHPATTWQGPGVMAGDITHAAALQSAAIHRMLTDNR